MKFEIKRLLNVKKFKFIEMKNAREHKREHNNNNYYNSSRKNLMLLKYLINNI